jgi:uncharacterized protein
VTGKTPLSVTVAGQPIEFLSLPELSGIGQFIRIPPELDVPTTPRVRAVIDSPAMQRLKEITQLGLVSFAYPGAVHSRFEHSLGVYRLACLVLKHLAQAEPEVANNLSQSEVKLFLLATLLHDVGHWPYCHPIEDMRLPEVLHHEQAARKWITQGQLADVIRDQWQVEPVLVADFLSMRSDVKNIRLLQNILNGPVDIDKMDYLQRDSLHAGVPYGRNFDIARLISSFRFGDSSQIAITAKGKTAAEMMVFSRYVMFSEVYWHHSVRSATAMLQRLVYRLRSDVLHQAWHEMSDSQFQQKLLELSANQPNLSNLAQSLFGRQRQLFKRFSLHNFAVSPEVHKALAHRPFAELVECAQRLSEQLSRRCQIPIGPNDLLIDAPPVKLEIQFKLDIVTEKGPQSLSDVSPVVRALATDQFDKFVKQVRVFVRPDLRAKLRVSEELLTELLLDS